MHDRSVSLTRWRQAALRAAWNEASKKLGGESKARIIPPCNRVAAIVSISGDYDSAVTCARPINWIRNARAISDELIIVHLANYPTIETDGDVALKISNICTTSVVKNPVVIPSCEPT